MKTLVHIKHLAIVYSNDSYIRFLLFAVFFRVAVFVTAVFVVATCATLGISMKG